MVSKLRFPKINYEYWSTKNNYFSDIPLLVTIKQGLEHASKAGLIKPLLEKIKTNADLVKLIQLKIKEYKKINDFSDLEILVIFDLIQGWGGRMGRMPYCRPKAQPVRMTLKELPNIYRLGVKYCVTGDYESALDMLMSIKTMGESFATKHIFFWSSEFGENPSALPIYDTRIKRLLFPGNLKSASYDVYVKLLNERAVELAMPSHMVERALFSFSQNYFSNNKLILKSDIVDNTDIKEAEFLQNIPY